jgi:hypothetical protein
MRHKAVSRSENHQMAYPDFGRLPNNPNRSEYNLNYSGGYIPKTDILIDEAAFHCIDTD